MNLRISLAVTAAALVAALAPAAYADQPAGTSVPVCNTATPTSVGGDLTALDVRVPNPSRFIDDLKAKPGLGEGQVTAAANSPALALCADLSSQNTDGSGDGSGGSGGGTGFDQGDV